MFQKIDVGSECENYGRYSNMCFSGDYKKIWQVFLFKIFQIWLLKPNGTPGWLQLFTGLSIPRKPLSSKSFIYLFILHLSDGGGRGRERERNIHMRETHRVVATHTIPTGAGDKLQPRYVP
uniref:Uncharacterized protein n=1 Tax=Molossus molossus TaxID=27622 RepID=A0A7J8FSJ9_MOLMO|nr:hypothetical protein HJG59_008369 [Molossus molossus]